jgi:hypothetical protein
MARYILIDNHSGYIFGDTADFATGAALEPCDAARTLDESIGEHGRYYDLMRHNPNDTRGGYHVYRADIDGSEAVAVVHDGQDRETIDAVTQSCRYEGFVTIQDAAE